MSWFGKWFDELLLKRVVGLVTRRLIDFIVGALGATVCFGTDVCESLGEWIAANVSSIEAFVLAAALAAVSTVWSFKQKKNDVKEIRKYT